MAPAPYGPRPFIWGLVLTGSGYGYSQFGTTYNSRCITRRLPSAVNNGAGGSALARRCGAGAALGRRWRGAAARPLAPAPGFCAGVCPGLGFRSDPDPLHLACALGPGLCPFKIKVNQRCFRFPQPRGVKIQMFFQGFRSPEVSKYKKTDSFRGLRIPEVPTYKQTEGFSRFPGPRAFKIQEILGFFKASGALRSQIQEN